MLIAGYENDFIVSFKFIIIFGTLSLSVDLVTYPREFKGPPIGIRPQNRRSHPPPEMKLRLKSKFSAMDV